MADPLQQQVNRLERQVRRMRGVLVALAALVPATHVVTSCKPAAPPPPTRLSFVDGENQLELSPSGVVLVQGTQQVKLQFGTVSAESVAIGAHLRIDDDSLDVSRGDAHATFGLSGERAVADLRAKDTALWLGVSSETAKLAANQGRARLDAELRGGRVRVEANSAATARLEVDERACMFMTTHASKAANDRDNVTTCVPGLR